MNESNQSTVEGRIAGMAPGARWLVSVAAPLRAADLLPEGTLARSLRSGLLAVLLAVPMAMASSPAEDLVLNDMQGQSHDIDRLLAEGKTVTLLFWQTWCTSCKREAPHVVEAARANADAIAFFGVVAGPDRSVDEGRVRETTKAWHFSFPQIRDRDLSLAHRYQAFGTPVIVILGPQRSVLYRGYRLPKDWSAYRGAAGAAGSRAPTKS